MRDTVRLSWSAAVVVVIAAAALASQERPAVPMDSNLFRDIARRQNPVVVAITTTAQDEEAAPELKDWFEWFFGKPVSERGHTRRGIGSGFLISPEGDILTNDHVVAGAQVIEVRLLGDGARTYRARLVGRDPLSDSALIRLVNPPRDLPFATLGDSDALEPGDWVMAIGNPFQLGHTVTVGVVSDEGRLFEVAEGTWQKLIQTDASINPGSSGGPLIDVRGEIVGINAAVLGADSGGGSGIGFAIPINGIKTLLPQLRAGKVIRGRIGVHLHNRAITGDEASALGLPDLAGALVISVERRSPAARAGVQAGDLAIAFDGQPVAAADDLLSRLSSTPPGTPVALTVIRDNLTRTLRVTVEELVVETTGGTEHRVHDPESLGLTLADLTAAAARQLGLPEGIDGALVDGVEDGSPAAQAGLLEGDLVRKVNRRVIHSAADGNRELLAIHGAAPLFLFVWREDHDVLVQLRQD